MFGSGDFHRDPADQLIVATSRVYDVPLLTADFKIINYPHVKLAHAHLRKITANDDQS